MKENIVHTVFSDDEYLYDELRRHQIYKEYSIVHNVRINPSEAFNWKNFVAFILNNIPLFTSSPSNNLTPNEDSQNINPFESLIAHPEEPEENEISEISE
ncbi:MAG: hypothetical protein LBH96_01940 [Candidatus Peribacteria bacterium]|jgi:hypothetical protein|nr:hypothetical protein [Candidatus Peribacteria bacterium]